MKKRTWIFCQIAACLLPSMNSIKIVQILVWTSTIFQNYPSLFVKQLFQWPWWVWQLAPFAWAKAEFKVKISRSWLLKLILLELLKSAKESKLSSKVKYIHKIILFFVIEIQFESRSSLMKLWSLIKTFQWPLAWVPLGLDLETWAGWKVFNHQSSAEVKKQIFQYKLFSYLFLKKLEVQTIGMFFNFVTLILRKKES